MKAETNTQGREPVAAATGLALFAHVDRRFDNIERNIEIVARQMSVLRGALTGIAGLRRDSKSRRIARVALDMYERLKPT